MADTTVRIGDNSPEYIAYMLMIDVLSADGVKHADRTRQLVLDTYAECLHAVKGNRSVPQGNPGSVSLPQQGRRAPL